MRGSERKHKWDEDNIRQFLLDGSEKDMIPESLQPEQMKEWLRQQCHMEEETAENEEEGNRIEDLDNRETDQGQEAENGWKRVGKHVSWRWCTFAAAACLALVLFAAGRNMDWGIVSGDKCAPESADDAAADGAADDEEEETESGEGTTYAQLYQSFERYWKAQEEFYRAYEENASAGEVAEAAEEETVDATADAADDAVTDDAAYAETTNQEPILDKGGDEVEDAADDAGADEQHEDTEDYGRTNQQEAEVEEADIIKNDGRYLYYVAYRANDARYRYTVRIVDTKDGLKEAAQVGSFDYVEDIYVWEDKLVVIVPEWAEGEEVIDGDAEEDSLWDFGYSYCRICVYDISDRTNPKEYHTFTVKGDYIDSRISEGYLYFFTSCQVSKPANAEDLSKYVPMLDGEPMAEDKITLPRESKAVSYLVMASVDMAQPDGFTDTRALVTSADKFYVSQSNIYVADMQYISYENEGSQSDSTMLYRYFYKDGKIRKEAEGKVKGTLRDDLAMNEYHGYLRLVTTVETEEVSKVVDDISGEFLGYDSTNYEMTNSLYVLDSNLDTVGKIEGLAKGERIYSARFMGNTGYFVTFRETDPLFSVDLSNPGKPQILGELKISGFSEYLHFYADNLLLGIGMEADEHTGETKGIKLSMFDISNPADVTEKCKLKLSEYEYSEALYNYKAVLIDTKKNLFGFALEDYDDEDGCAYMLFTFENGEFRKIMEIDYSDWERYGYTVRGTYIGDRFFLLAKSGVVEEYSLIDGSKTAELNP